MTQRVMNSNRPSFLLIDESECVSAAVTGGGGLARSVLNLPSLTLIAHDRAILIQHEDQSLGWPDPNGPLPGEDGRIRGREAADEAGHPWGMPNPREPFSIPRVLTGE